MVKSTESDKVIDTIANSRRIRQKKVNEVTLDLAPIMERIIKKEVS